MWCSSVASAQKFMFGWPYCLDVHSRILDIYVYRELIIGFLQVGSLLKNSDFTHCVDAFRVIAFVCLFVFFLFVFVFLFCFVLFVCLFFFCFGRNVLGPLSIFRHSLLLVGLGASLIVTLPSGLSAPKMKKKEKSNLRPGCIIGKMSISAVLN